MNAPAPAPPPLAASAGWPQRWRRFSAAALRAFHVYANWLVSISWRRFFVLAALLLVLVGILHDLPPFTWTFTEHIEAEAQAPRVMVPPPRPAAAPPAPKAARQGDANDGVQINIGKDGIRITPHKPAATAAAAAATAAAASAASAAGQEIQINLPPGVASDAVRQAVEEARQQIEESIRSEREDAEQATREAADARRDAEAAIEELAQQRQGRASARTTRTTRTTRIGIGDLLLQLSFFWVIASAVVKATYKGRVQAEVKAAQATETAEAEALKRQVVEARMATMQAQVEPHFLFNTLASIDHLIETDPARASVMQKNLIALLRASMPTLREASDGGVRDLGRELALIRPYLEILKVRMEERLSTEMAVPEGLLSAEFPPMMIQTLVENAIKHGLEPKAEGGALRVAAEIVHGKLVVSVADTGLGFGRAATAGTGVGLANIRERLQLLYGARASLTVAENRPSGTVVTVTVPYKMIEGEAARNAGAMNATPATPAASTITMPP